MSKEEKKTRPIDLNDLAGLIVHSYNNYLSGSMGYAELALLESKNTEVNERINCSLESSNKAVHFGKTILATTSRLHVSMTDNPLAALIQSIEESVDSRRLIVENNDLEDVLIKTDSSWFVECIVDVVEFLLLYNATEFVKLSTKVNPKNPRLIITLHNDATQFSVDALPWLFTPFYSSRILLGKKDIGLSKAKGFFKQMDSELNWSNEEGFTIEVPVVKGTL